jgi:DNA-binding GntR family transcriptional regulator
MLSRSEISKEGFDVQTANILRQLIVSGDIEAGARLTEAKLGEKFHVSRGTVRAALHKLRTEGLVVQIPYTGWHVTSIDSQDAWELHHLRRVLDGLAARLAAERLDSKGAESLESAYKGLCRACESRDLKAITSADFKLHRVIVSLARHRRLEEHYKLIEQQLQVFIASCNADFTERDMIGQRHERLVKAILAHDADAAERFAKEHNEGQGAAVIERLSRTEGTRALPSARQK